MKTRKKFFKTVHVNEHPELYKIIENERRKFMKEQGLEKLSSVAFRGVFARKLIESKKGKYGNKKK